MTLSFFGLFQDTRKDIQLSSLKNEIERFNQELIEINEEQKNCIASFQNSYNLVKWLQSAQTGLSFLEL